MPRTRCATRNSVASRRLQYSVFGERGDYSAMVRCATEKGVIFFVIAGPEVERVDRYVDDVSDGF